jgi:ankyrin repeat protein
MILCQNLQENHMLSKLSPLLKQKLIHDRDLFEQYFYAHPRTGTLKAWTFATGYWIKNEVFHLALAVEAVVLVIINGALALSQSGSPHFKASVVQLKDSAFNCFFGFLGYIFLGLEWQNKAAENSKLRTEKGWLPIHFAVEHNNRPLLEQILAQGRDAVNRQTTYSTFSQTLRTETPLHIAARRNLYELALQLLEAGADVTIRTENWNFSPLDTAVVYGSVEMIHLFAGRGVDLNTLNYQGMAPLHYASTTLYQMVGGGSHHFKRDNMSEGIEALVSRGANVELPTSMGLTPLMLAAYDDQPDAVRALLAAGARPNTTTNNRGQTALHLAAESCQIKSMNALGQARGVNVNARDGSGQTVLHYAAMKVLSEVVLAIANLPNVDFTVRDGSGRTPYQIAKYRFDTMGDNREILELFAARTPQAAQLPLAVQA